MKLSELAEKMTIQDILIIGEDGEAERMDWNDATRERYGDIKVMRVGQGIYESPWQLRQYPQESVAFGLVVIVS